jgi:hypothetical protein
MDGCGTANILRLADGASDSYGDLKFMADGLHMRSTTRIRSRQSSPFFQPAIGIGSCPEATVGAICRRGCAAC